MSSLNSKLGDILFGIERLLNRNYSFDKTFNDYELSSKKNKVNLNKLWRLKEFNNTK